MNIEELTYEEAISLREQLNQKIADLIREKERTLWRKVLDSIQEYEAACGGVTVDVEDIFEERSYIIIDVHRSVSTPGELQWN